MSRPVKNLRFMGTAGKTRETKPNDSRQKAYGGVVKADARKPIGPNYTNESKLKADGPTMVTNRFTSHGD